MTVYQNSNSIISRFCFFSLLLLSFNPRNSYAQISIQDNADIKLMEAINSQQYSVKMQAARSFPEGIIDQKKGARLLISALRTDLESPISNEFFPRAIGSKSDQLRRQYVFAIARLGSNFMLDLHVFIDSSSGEIKDWLYIISGFLHDENAHESLKEMILAQESNDKKALATRALSQYAYPIDTLLFMSLLNDPYIITITKDHDVPGGEFREDIYPVREEAAGALRMLGFIVLKDNEGRFRIEGRR